MPAPRLELLARKACIKNVRSIKDIGDFEYIKIRPILMRVDSPEQLHQLELNSPHIKEDDAELWQTFIAKEIPDWQKKNYHPKNPTKWYEIYCKYKREQQREIEKDEEILRQQMGLLQKAKATNVSQIVDLRRLPKLPKDPRMLVQNGGAPLKKKGGVAGILASGAVSWGGGSRTRTNGAQGVLLKAKREAKEITQMSRLSKPAHQLSGRPGQIKKAPAAMVNEHRKAALPEIKIISRRKDPIKMSEAESIRPSLEEREKRLRALTMHKDGAANVTWVDSSDEEEGDSDEVDDLFDEPTPQARIATPSLSRSSNGVHSPSSIRTTAQSSTSTPDRLQPLTPSACPPPLSKPAQKSTSSIRSRPNLPTPPSSTHNTSPKPSNIISSIISKPKLSPSSLQPPSSLPAPSQNSRGSSPAGTVRPKGMMPRKRPQEVDVFNRGKKKARMS